MAGVGTWFNWASVNRRVQGMAWVGALSLTAGLIGTTALARRWSLQFPSAPWFATLKAALWVCLPLVLGWVVLWLAFTVMAGGVGAAFLPVLVIGSLVMYAITAFISLPYGMSLVRRQNRLDAGS